eukprot:gene12909-13036_t
MTSGFWGPPGGMSGEADAFRRMHMERMMAQRQQHGPGGLSKEVRVQRFKQLLLEGGVNAFSFYAKVKGKLEKDDRALLEEALQLERQLYVALLAESLSRQEEEQQAEEAGKTSTMSLLLAAGPGGAAVPSPEEVPEEALDLSLEQLERYWSNDDRWEAAKPEQRASLFQVRLSAWRNWVDDKDEGRDGKGERERERERDRGRDREVHREREREKDRIRDGEGYRESSSRSQQQGRDRDRNRDDCDDYPDDRHRSKKSRHQ